MEPPPETLTIADRALLAAQRGWCGDADDRFWQCFAPGWRQVLRQGWNESAGLDGEASRERIRREHRAQARPDLSRVHPSWWLRALKEETPAVQRAVVAGAPAAVGAALRAGLGLGLGDDDLRPDRPPLREALEGALALWTERLVGDWADRDDPPVIVALTRLDLKEVARLTHVLAIAKWAASGLDLAGVKERDRARLDHFRGRFAGQDARRRHQAIRDVGKYGQARGKEEGRLGLLTLARLLDVAEPYRVRWALQHIPYSLAKYVRTLMRPRIRNDAALVPWEADILTIACDRLRDEGYLAQPSGGLT